jgi:hypothetical protein
MIAMVNQRRGSLGVVEIETECRPRDNPRKERSSAASNKRKV